LRHAIAEDRTTPQIKSDKDRSLTAKGEKKMRRIAKGMKELGLEFELILSSPYLRAKQTAEIAAKELKLQNVLEFSSNLAPGGSPKTLIEELNENGAKSICLVGHEPYLSNMISFLTSGDAGLELALKKGGLCKLSLEELRVGRCATMEWLLSPKHLECLG
jgi:phosphohistidine phosphatase